MSKASAQFTLMDYTDGISLITGIDSNLPLTLLYDTANQTLNPSWAESTSLQLTPRVIKAGSSTSLVETMTSRKWYRRNAGGDWTEILSGQNGETINSSTGVLTVSQDKLTGNIWQVDYKFEGTYTDPNLGLPFPISIAITFSRVANGTSFVVARAYATGGNQFKNGSPASLPIKAELIRGTTADTTNLSYKWQKSTNGTSWSDVSGQTTDTLNVVSSIVDSFAIFRCQITDTDANSDTYNSVFNTEGISILDVSDPYQCVIESTAGNFFKNETGSTILICRVFQNGAEVDTTGASFTYTWTMNDKDGNPVSSFSPTGVQTGSIVATNKKAISVSHDQVNVKATFFCEID